MPASSPSSVSDYIAGLQPDQRAAVKRVRAVVKKALPKGYKEGMGWGVITWHIPLSAHPDTYNGQPLCIAALAAHKNHCSLYLMGAYGDPVQRKVLEDGFRKAGKKLDMGKSCVRFRTADDLPLDVVSKVIGAIPPARFIEMSRRERPSGGKGD